MGVVIPLVYFSSGSWGSGRLDCLWGLRMAASMIWSMPGRELSVGLGWVVLVGVGWSLVDSWLVWAGVVVMVRALGPLCCLFVGGVPGPVMDASSILLTLEAEVLLLVAIKGDGEVGGDGLSSPWIGGCGSGGSVGPGSGII